MAAYPKDPNDTLIPKLWVDEKTEVCCTYYGSFQDAVYSAQAADTLHLGWRLDAYVGQISDTEDQQEWRLVIWKELRADAVISRPPEPATPEA